MKRIVRGLFRSPHQMRLARTLMGEQARARARARGRRNGKWMRDERGAVLVRAPGGQKAAPGRIRLLGVGIKAQEEHQGLAWRRLRVGAAWRGQVCW